AARGQQESDLPPLAHELPREVIWRKNRRHDGKPLPLRRLLRPAACQGQRQKNQGHENCCNIFHVSSRNGKRKGGHPFRDARWQREKDSNPHIRSQSPLCYLYTIALCAKDIISEFSSLSSKICSRSNINQHKAHQHAE